MSASRPPGPLARIGRVRPGADAGPSPGIDAARASAPPRASSGVLRRPAPGFLLDMLPETHTRSSRASDDLGRPDRVAYWRPPRSADPMRREGPGGRAPDGLARVAYQSPRACRRGTTARTVRIAAGPCLMSGAAPGRRRYGSGGRWARYRAGQRRASLRICTAAIPDFAAVVAGRNSRRSAGAAARWTFGPSGSVRGPHPGSSNGP